MRCMYVMFFGLTLIWRKGWIIPMAERVQKQNDQQARNNFSITVHTVNESHDTCIWPAWGRSPLRSRQCREGGEIPLLIICTQEWHPESVMLIMHQITARITPNKKHCMHCIVMSFYISALQMAPGRNWERLMFAASFLFISPVSTEGMLLLLRNAFICLNTLCSIRKHSYL